MLLRWFGGLILGKREGLGGFSVLLTVSLLVDFFCSVVSGGSGGFTFVGYTFVVKVFCFLTNSLYCI